MTCMVYSAYCPFLKLQWCLASVPFSYVSSPSHELINASYNLLRVFKMSCLNELGVSSFLYFFAIIIPGSTPLEIFVSLIAHLSYHHILNIVSMFYLFPSQRQEESNLELALFLTSFDFVLSPLVLVLWRPSLWLLFCCYFLPQMHVLKSASIIYFV